jgi:hypothetical protein
MAKIVNPEIYKAVRAFNERLSYAEKRYGKGSAIVKELRSGAQNVPQLTWTKSGKISTGVKNQEAINKPFIKSEFSKYVHNASAAEIIKSKFSKEQLEEIEKLKGKARAAKEEEIFSRIKTMKDIYTRIYHEVYELTKDRERAAQCYDAAKLPEFEHAVLKWNDGGISSYELIAILEGEADTESEDSMYADVPNLYDDDELR